MEKVFQGRASAGNSPASNSALVRTRQSRSSEEGEATRAAETLPGAAPAASSNVGRLDTPVQSYFESRLGFDFSSVRVHADAAGGAAAVARGALAFVNGSDLHVRPGLYRPEHPAGARLLAHELMHVAQQGYAPSLAGECAAPDPHDALERDKVVVNLDNVLMEIKTRAPELAALVSAKELKTLDGTNVPVIKTQKGEDTHEWSVDVTEQRAMQGSSITGMSRKETPKAGKAKGKVIKHHAFIKWSRDFDLKHPDPDFAAQAQSHVKVKPAKGFKQRSKTEELVELTITEQLMHELLHFQIMMETDPEYTGRSTSLVAGFSAVMTLAHTPTVAKERKSVRDAIVLLLAMTDSPPGGQDLKNEPESFVDFLVHERFDSQTVFQAMGKLASNALVAHAYSKVVANTLIGRYGAPADSMRKNWAVRASSLEAAIVALYDAIDAAAVSPSTTMPPTAKPEEP